MESQWNNHIDSIANNLRYLLSKFRYLNTFLDVHHLKIVYYALVESRIRYGILGWGGVHQTYLNKINVLQKRILKIIYNKPRTYPSETIYKLSNVMDPRKIHMYSIILYIYNHKNILQWPNHQYQTRHRENSGVLVETSKKTVGQRCLTYLAGRVFNFLPNIYKTYLTALNSENMIKNKFKFFVKNLEQQSVHKLIDVKN